ncbi:hypothetical protein KUTeg_019539 [Tegillarca granosa]|uniref:CARMIL C-terminal domain-containing protein n=1 Tax=Tegillarca granosa TaxID=220873 RepID=A0ABQ9ECU5_TEGGR|nr:hypothetical protein KUTeg_019539 [Tegillarca granosa]
MKQHYTEDNEVCDYTFSGCRVHIFQARAPSRLTLVVDDLYGDVNTIYSSQDSRELRLQDFDHLNQKDLVPIISALEHNPWFTKLNVDNVKLLQGISQLNQFLAQPNAITHLDLSGTECALENIPSEALKLMPQVLDSVVKLIQDEDLSLESLSLADSKLKKDTAVVVNALGSNVTLTHLDLRNYTLRKMPTPVNDAAQALLKQPERTETALQKIEVLLQRNHSPQKYSSDQAYRLQQGFLISSTQQLLSTLQDIAIKSVSEDSPVEQRLQQITTDLMEVIQSQMKKTVSQMIESTKVQCTSVMKDESVLSELESSCAEKSALPKDFTKNVLEGVETEIINKLNELNLAVATLISDKVIDSVLDNLSTSHKTLVRPKKNDEIKA